MTELAITGDRVLAIWWAFLWRMLVASTIFTILWLLADRLGVATNYELRRGLDFVFSVVCGFFVLGMALRAQYRAFRIVLIPQAPAPPVVPEV